MARALDSLAGSVLREIHWSAQWPYSQRPDVDDIDALRNAGNARLLADLGRALEMIEQPRCAFCDCVQVARHGDYCSDICRDMDEQQQDATDEHIARPWEFKGWGEEG